MGRIAALQECRNRRPDGHPRRGVCAGGLYRAGFGSALGDVDRAKYDGLVPTDAPVAPAAEGDAIFQVDLDEQGRVLAVRFVGFENLVNTTPQIEAEFQARALSYIENNLRFRPAKKDGVAVAESNVPVRVRLRCKHAEGDATNC